MTQQKHTVQATSNTIHSADDHLFGADFSHSHEGIEADHDHDEIEVGPIEDNPIWIQDHVTLVSVGIDIGSSGTQVVFSRINMRRLGEDLTSRYFVVSRETLYQSPVALTPYKSAQQIDQIKLGAIIDDAYNSAKIRPANIDSGAVILTGEALRRENSEAISEILAEQGGKFVCATAGHHMECMLAAYGSGASRVSNDSRQRILNIDIGGGTTKLAIVEKGHVLQTAAIHIGGRLQVVDDESKIIRLEPAGYKHAKAAGFDWVLDQEVAHDSMEQVAELMAENLFKLISSAADTETNTNNLYLTDPITDFGVIDGIMFSGGVAEYIYDRESRDFGDMGKLLGQAIRKKILSKTLPYPVLPAGECIRATALGASEYSVQLSGNTIFISNRTALLPRKNLQVLQPQYTFTDEVSANDIQREISTHFTTFDLVEGEQDVALAFYWQGLPSYKRISALAKGIINALPNTIKKNTPIYLVLDSDIAQTLGNMLQKEFNIKNELLIIDGILLKDFDYIDLGRVRMPSFTVPVTVKSLLFNDNMGEDMDNNTKDQKHSTHEHTHT